MWYDVDRLLQFRGVTEEETERLFAEGEVSFRMENGKRQIEDRELERFFDAVNRDVEYPYYDIPDFLARGDEPWKAALRESYGHRICRPVSIDPQQGQLIHDMVLEERPTCVVEIGCFIGVSTLWIASALKKLGGKRCVYSLDVFPPFIMPGQVPGGGYIVDPMAYAGSMCMQAGLDGYFSLLRTRSEAFSKVFGQFIHSAIDMLFIDGDHSIKGAVQDFFLYEPFVRPGGTILMDDVPVKMAHEDGPFFLMNHVLPRFPERFWTRTIPIKSRDNAMAFVRKLR